LLFQIHAFAASVLFVTAADAWGRHGRPADSDGVLRDHQARQVRPGWPWQAPGGALAQAMQAPGRCRWEAGC